MYNALNERKKIVLTYAVSKRILLFAVLAGAGTICEGNISL